MTHFEQFEGFRILDKFEYVAFSQRSPVGTACGLLRSYRGMEAEIGCDVFPDGMKRAEIIVPNSGPINVLFHGIKRDSCDFLYIDIPEQEMYVLQRIVIGRK